METTSFGALHEIMIKKKKKPSQSCYHSTEI